MSPPKKSSTPAGGVPLHRLTDEDDTPVEVPIPLDPRRQRATKADIDEVKALLAAHANEDKDGFKSIAGKHEPLAQDVSDLKATVGEMKGTVTMLATNTMRIVRRMDDEDAARLRLATAEEEAETKERVEHRGRKREIGKKVLITLIGIAASAVTLLIEHGC